MKMKARLGAASCTQGLQIYSQEVSPCLLEALSCSENTADNWGKFFLTCWSGNKR